MAQFRPRSGRLPLRYRVRRWLRIFAGLVFLAALAWVGWQWDAASLRHVTPGDGAATRAIDGDSLSIPHADQTVIVRIDGIDAPEFRQTCQRADASLWPCGAEAHAVLAGLVLQQGLDCAVRALDRYQRGVARCRTTQTPDIGAEMVSRGLAIASGRGDFPAYALEEDRARAARRGIWQGEFVRPAEWREANPRS